jgi:hypothetical protein
METAFKVLRSAGYAAHALSVAERAGQPEWILDVLLEDMASYAEAVAFIGEQGTLSVWAETGHAWFCMTGCWLPPTTICVKRISTCCS